MYPLFVLSSLLVSAPPTIALHAIQWRDQTITVEPITIERGAPPTKIECSEQTGILDVILPPAIGSSAGLTRFSDGKTIELEWNDDGLSVRDSLASGASYARPVRDPATLANEVVRVSVLPWQGDPCCVRIDGHRTAEVDDGPPLDLFQGKIPLGKGDFVISTETTKRLVPQSGGGKAPLVENSTTRGWPLLEVLRDDGTKGRFVVDVGAVSTIVARSFVPKATEIHELAMTQFRGGSAEVLPFAPQGATGTVNVLGEAQFHRLRAGTIEWSAADLLVVETLPQGSAGPIDGILGLDLLSQFGTLEVDFASGTIELGGKRKFGPTSLPFALVGGAVIVRGSLRKQDMYWLVDTGAPDSFIENATADGLGFPVANVSRPASGLDGGSVEVATCGNQSLAFSGQSASDVPVLVADFPVLATRRAGKIPLGILGMSALRRFQAMTIDFGARRIEFRK